MPGLDIVVDNYDFFDSATQDLGIYEMLGANWFTQSIGGTFCGTFEALCHEIGDLGINKHPETDDQDRFTVYAGHMPHGTPTQSLLLYGQNAREDRF